MRLAICLGLVWLFSLGTGVCWGQSAEALLKASGVQAGLIVHLDCGDGALTAEFSRSGQFLVRGRKLKILLMYGQKAFEVG